MKIEILKNTLERFASRKSRDPDEIDAARIISNPKYAQVLAKLDELYIQRGVLAGQLEKIELDIDACLLMLSMNEKKEEINAREKAFEKK